MRALEINCSGEKHEIKLSPKGKLIFLNHNIKEFKSEEILERVSGEKSPNNCYRFWKFWKEWDVENLLNEFYSQELIKIIDNIEMIKVKRYIKEGKDK
ncbi:hypothetical protein SAMN04244560_02144 [Thermoanaerobacter thermohydrosulfuricus]|uniref:Uncharacterized protein n=1 Tax=Thermoanaerobacter thermohydrosulfuricus TaxID=1516 RepID=A0A1G7TAF0_THETY|nr:hypothetical protein [Thermoanaerobacter thermohydrosulfuricus]SDG32072.1 hypothetical protein SAMN04244560_02144 [Thermoanaerobacter thermohydrosulfuricus]